MKKDYVETIYNEDIRPKTDYPLRLTRHLTERFKIKSGEFLLDVGCGRGEFAAGFQKAGLRVEGIDTSDYAVKKLAEIGLKVHQVRVDRESWPFPDNSVDIIFSKSLLEHLHNPDHLMRETYRVLKPGGRVIVMTPDWESCMKVFYDDHTHVQPYSIRALNDLLRMYSFKNSFTEKFYQLPVVWKYPWLKMFSKILQGVVNPNPGIKNKFIRWSVELMCLGSGIK